MENCQAAIVDVETTGISAKDEIIEIAILLFTYDPKTGIFLNKDGFYQGYQEPSFPIDEAASAIHGLTREKLRGKKLNRERIAELLEKADFLVAHNAVFDRGFVGRSFPEFKSKQWHCSMRSINWIAAGCANKQLQTILARHQIIPTRAHSAHDDVTCLYKLLSLPNSKTGKPYFAEVMSAPPVKTVWEAAGSSDAGRYLTGIYVDEWEEWMASYLKAGSSTRQKKWNSLSPERRDYLRKEYNVREHDDLFTGL